MRFGHVIVTLVTGCESLHTKPANMCRAPPARHMIATITFLDWCLAIWTLPHVILLFPFLECLRTLRCQILVFFASHTVMSDNVTSRTDRGETSRAEKVSASRCDPVYLRTVGCRAVLEDFRMGANINVERYSEKFYKGGLAEHRPQLADTKDFQALAAVAQEYLGR